MKYPWILATCRWVDKKEGESIFALSFLIFLWYCLLYRYVQYTKESKNWYWDDCLKKVRSTVFRVKILSTVQAHFLKNKEPCQRRGMRDHCKLMHAFRFLLLIIPVHLEFASAIRMMGGLWISKAMERISIWHFGVDFYKALVTQNRTSDVTIYYFSTGGAEQGIFITASCIQSQCAKFYWTRNCRKLIPLPHPCLSKEGIEIMVIHFSFIKMCIVILISFLFKKNTI